MATKIPEAELGKLARILDAAEREVKAVEKLTIAKPGLSLEDAYRIQEICMRLRITRGHRLIGMKMGITSYAKMQQIGVKAPIYGVLTDSMQVSEGGIYSLKGKIHPKIEP